MTEQTQNLDADALQLGAVLHRGQRSLLQFATWTGTQQRVVQKAIAPGVTENRARHRLRHEHAMLRRAQGPGVVTLHALATTQLGLALVVDAIDGESIAAQLAGAPWHLQRILDLAVNLVTALQGVHARGVFHLDLNPDHVLLTRGTGAVTLIDFSRASQLPLPSPEPTGRTPAAVAWLAPEQTGRLDRLADARADLYAVGAILYRLLAGRMPLWDEDPLALVHAIVAHPPPPLLSLRRDVPEVVCRIVDRLLEKSPDDRYQSAAGLANDLRTCQLALQRTGTIAPFEIGRADRSGQLLLPSVLYGRAEDVQALAAAVERVCAGQASSVAVLGPAGIGKTSVVHELRPWARARGGLFAAGKFDQLLHTEAFGPLRVALDPVIRQILTLRANQVEAWRLRLTAAIGAAADVVVGLLPALQALLPAAQAGRTLSATDTQARQLAAITDLLRALHQPQTPLLLFLDDMQWADAATLDLVETILRLPDPRNPVLILAWRDNEVTAGHPLQTLFHRLSDGGPVRITLAPLQAPHVARMLSDALGMPEAAVRPLAERVTERAEGNPFEIREILVALADAGALAFDQTLGHWQWSLDSVDRIAARNGVAELLARRLDALPPESAALLAEVACVGQEVDVELLALALGRPMQTVVRDAAVLGARGLLVPVGEGWEIASGLGAEPTHATDTPQRLVVRFPHDRVQEAARARLDEHARVALHLQFAERMWQAGVAQRHDRGLFLVAEQVMRGMAQLASPGDRAAALERLALAAQRARDLGAFAPAVAFAEAALTLLPADAPDHASAFALHLAAAESAMVLGDRTRAEEHVHAGERSAPDVLAQVALDRVRIRGHLARGEHEAAVNLSGAALDRLGLGTPLRPKPHHLALAFGRVLWRMRGTTRASLGQLPVCDDPRVAASLSLMAEALISAYLIEPNLTALWTLELVDRTMRHGVTPQGAYAIASYGFLRAAFFGDVTGGAMYETAAYDIIARLGATEMLAKVELMDWGFVQNRLQPLRAGIAVWARVVRHGIEGGDVTHAAQAATNAVAQAMCCGVDVDELERHGQNALAICLRFRQDRSVPWAQLYLQAVDCLRAKVADPLVLSGDFIVKEAWLAAHHGDASAGVSFALLEGQLAIWQGHAARALPSLERAEKGVNIVPGTYLVPNIIGYTALARVAAAREAQDAGHASAARQHIARARKGLRKLGPWLKPKPLNYVQLRDLLKAELADVQGRWEDATRAYEAAVASATLADHGFDKALALELAGQAWLRRGHGRAAAAYLLEARATWMQHGVVAGIDRFEALLQRAQGSGGLVAPYASGPALASPENSGLDATAIARAARALSAEIRVDALLTQLLRLAVQTAGATSGALLLVRDGKATVAALARDIPGGLDVRSLTTGASREGADPDEVLGPMAAVAAYVQHTRESLLLDAAWADPRFADAFDQRGGNAILAAPLIRAGELVGIVTLEHRDMSGAFNAQRLEMVETLAAQAAVSLVNALLYESLDAALDDQKRLTRAFQRFVPQEFMTQLGKTSILQVSIGDHVQQEVTALFADIRGFTTLAERLGPKETFAFVNRYLAEMEPAIYGHNGHVEQFLGDGIMAVFPGKADDAVQAALAMFEALARFNAERAKLGEPAISIGIGINTGTVMVGVIGGRSRMDRGLIGDPVNVASRVEGLCKGYVASLLIGGDTRARLADPERYQLRLLDRVIASGKEQPTDVYEVLDAELAPRRAAKLAGRAAYERGVALWQASKPGQARVAFVEALAACPEDAAAQLFVERCDDAELRGTQARADGASRLAWK